MSRKYFSLPSGFRIPDSEPLGVHRSSRSSVLRVQPRWRKRCSRGLWLEPLDISVAAEAVGTVENSEWNEVEWRVLQAAVGMWKII